MGLLSRAAGTPVLHLGFLALVSPHGGRFVGHSEVIVGPDLPGRKLPTPDKSDYRTCLVPLLHLSGYHVY
jgi:hypothetical protein